MTMIGWMTGTALMTATLWWVNRPTRPYEKGETMMDVLSYILVAGGAMALMLYLVSPAGAQDWKRFRDSPRDCVVHCYNDRQRQETICYRICNGRWYRI